MSQAASQAWAFYRDVAKNRKVWTIRDAGGFPAPKASDGSRAQPFWSSLSRVQRIIKTAPAYTGFQPHEISWEDFCAKWVPGLSKDSIKVGVNWSGAKVIGYDIEAEKLRRSVEAMIQDSANT